MANFNGLNEQDFKAISKCLKNASDAILTIYHSNDFAVERKSDHSPVTAADHAANDIICSFLSNHFPEVPILSEENKQQTYEVRKHWDYYWLLDPLDGTKEFVSRNGDFTINLALCKQNKPVTGFIYIPVSDSLYFNTGSEKAYIQNESGTQRIQTEGFDPGKTGLKLICSRSHLNEATQAFSKQFDAPNFVQRGSALKFMMVAEGKAALYPRFAPTMEWDTAAADAILHAAGGHLYRLHHTGITSIDELSEPLQYNKEDLLNPGFVAMGKPMR